MRKKHPSDEDEDQPFEMRSNLPHHLHSLCEKKPVDSKNASEKDSSSSTEKSKVEEDTSSPFMHPKKKTTTTTTTSSVKKRTPPVRRYLAACNFWSKIRKSKSRES